MALNIFRRRGLPAVEQVKGVTPGEFGDRNAMVFRMARKFILAGVAANVGSMVLSIAMMDRLEETAPAYETFLSSVWISSIGLGTLAAIAVMFWVAGRFERTAMALHAGAGAGQASPEVEHHMVRAAKLIHLGYRLTLFVGVTLVMAVIMAIRGLMSV
ncbi:MAG: hypothetical protein QF654_07325 [Alphaproteobacteria bacterium]|jgi:hypothetical protein|nr:hypothetical protein [Alphaproteobacteria bacterium]|tara:strand:+ start:292 stop:765 length:474 start_codon:yes stop_codon:yes gene_type:complete